MSYTQLTQDERYHIQYLSRHCTVTEIAKQLNRHKSTISREIRRHHTQKGSNTVPNKPNGKAG